MIAYLALALSILALAIAIVGGFPGSALIVGSYQNTRRRKREAAE